MTRQEKIDQLTDLRLDWTWEDYIESYNDEWDEMPTTLKECHEKMCEYIYNTYDDELIQDCIDNEDY
jgi:hypothetical protein